MGCRRLLTATVITDIDGAGMEANVEGGFLESLVRDLDKDNHGRGEDEEDCRDGEEDEDEAEEEDGDEEEDGKGKEEGQDNFDSHDKGKAHKSRRRRRLASLKKLWDLSINPHVWYTTC